MAFFRPLHRKHYDAEREGFGFSSSALDLRSGEPFSVVDCECARAESGTLCAHIARYYNEQSGNPQIYWPIRDADLPVQHRIEAERTPNGDECHRNLYGWPRNAVRRIFKSLTLEELIVCLPDAERPLINSDLESYPPI